MSNQVTKSDNSEPLAPAGEPAIRVIAMPANTNADGRMFGGWLMGMLDQAAGLVAARHALARVVTVAADSITFHAPVQVGDELSLYARLVKVGRTSMKIEVEGWRRVRHELETIKAISGLFTFVAIDEDRRPCQVPPMNGTRLLSDKADK
ncbi:acyl-CoA thioesterase [Zymomonas mobilis]|uniref:Thioesterase superfamily protein n=1 Tax=Zymomonas mobilis subsp. mobilis (strain ATCC 10988 / DSM 424 / LMG 404 / NCIMB 8938 / NRRL B-806 / ZM1) TaxID=555217 RepID=A0A0H3FYM2_ZYMMA|nr:acyl-CoA thioesterase [Zymomonas mobilis]AEH62870.1 thioesterase superfamily protein [Zymomonas mobilis subsp. mobilis ATCC 10988]TQL27522.1 acyl-CoA thioesterase YciA [Zymomonas mobilis]TQL29465.1 acyl-CoA thioesterase YciA [Zymomonas mobilis]